MKIGCQRKGFGNEFKFPPQYTEDSIIYTERVYIGPHAFEVRLHKIPYPSDEEIRRLSEEVEALQKRADLVESINQKPIFSSDRLRWILFGKIG